MYRAVKEKKCAWAPSYYLRMGGSRKIRNVKAVVRRAIYVTRGGGHVKYRGGGVLIRVRKEVWSDHTGPTPTSPTRHATPCLRSALDEHQPWPWCWRI